MTPSCRFRVDKPWDSTQDSYRPRQESGHQGRSEPTTMEMTMRFPCLLVLLALIVPASAHATDIELTAFGGYNTGGTLDVRDDVADKNQLKVAGSFATGLGVAFIKNERYAFELFWGWRPTNLEGPQETGGERNQITSLNAYDFHGNFLFGIGDPYAKVTPFILLGLGATHLNPGDIAPSDMFPDGLSPSSRTAFSWALGAGIKTYMNKKVGLRAQIRYHSTYVSDQAGGTWCDPYYGCYQTVDTNWLDEWEFTAGLIYRPGS